MQIAAIETKQTYDLRQRVLRPGLPLDACYFPLDGQSKHFGVFDEDQIISIVSAHPEASPKFPGTAHWRVRGMATDPKWQGMGAGGLVLQALLDWGQNERVPLFWGNVRERAIPFYLRHGFLVAGELFDIPGVGPHKVMWREST